VLPNFFILGAAKSGTTSLYRYLGQHPDVYFPANKEPQFFSHDLLFERGVDFYCDRFFRGVTATWRGDASPHYLLHPKAGARIRELMGIDACRFLVVLRDPVARAYSHYRNMIYEGVETLPFAEALAAEEERISIAEWERQGSLKYAYFRGSCYAQQLSAYFSLFPRERFLVIFSEELKESPVEVTNKVFRFLGIASVTIDVGARHNQAAEPRSRRFQSWVRRPSALRRIIGYALPYDAKLAIAKGLLRLNRRDGSPEPLSAAEAAQLRGRLMPDIEQLEGLLGLDLNGWKCDRGR